MCMLKHERSKDVIVLSKQIVEDISVLHENRFIENLKWHSSPIYQMMFCGVLF